MQEQREQNLSLFERLDASPVAVVEWDADMRVTHWSSRAEQIFGLRSAEALGSTALAGSFVSEEEKTRWTSAMRGLLAGGCVSRTEHLRHRCVDGRVVHCGWYCTAQCDGSGRVTAIFSLIIDESESKQIERQLQEQSERFEFALESAHMGCWDWEVGTDRMSWFGSMDELFGYAKGEFPGDGATALGRVHPEDHQRIRDGFGLESLRRNQNVDVEYRLVLPEGTVRWIHSRGRAVFDERGGLLRITGTAVDMTDRKLGEQTLLAAKSSAETSSAAKSAFVANMSHEIRTPLGVILGFAELLSDPSIEPADRSYYMSIIARNGEHLSRLIDDILDLSKVEAGQLEMQEAVIPLRATLSEVLSGLQSRAFDKGVNLVIDQAGDVPDEIKVDPVRFKQVIGNLAGNALKFTEKGEVRVSILCEPGPTPYLKLRVRDTGAGMSEDGQKRLFSPFGQVDRALTHRTGGTGLGLALSRQIARALGGDIALVSSRLGEGSVFEFVLPGSVFLVPPRDRPSGSPTVEEVLVNAEALSPTLAGLRLLLAEDSADLQVLMQRILTKRGAALTMVGDGEEAVRRATGGEFDVILMDIQMPKLDGYEATRTLRQGGYSKPILALTAHAMKEERERSLAAGCDGHIPKPVQVSELIDTILRFARKTSSVRTDLAGFVPAPPPSMH